MNEKLNDIFSEIKKTRLTEQERILQRNSISAFMAEHPARAPFRVRAADALSSIPGIFDTGSHGMRLAGATLALVLVIGVGTSYAAEGALPGDLLYPVKVSITESIQGALASSESAKAQWNTQLVSRRLAEAGALSDRDALTPVARAELENRIEISVARLDESVEQLVGAKDGGAIIASIQSKLEQSLQEHERGLLALGEDEPGDAAESARTMTMMAAFSASAPVSENSKTRAMIERTIALTKNSRTKIDALKQREDVRSALSVAKDKIEEARMDHATESVESAVEHVSAAEADVRSGDESIGEGEYTAALTTFRAATRSIQETTERLEIGTTSTSTSDENSDEQFEAEVRIRFNR
jgi:hypothetical protein